MTPSATMNRPPTIRRIFKGKVAKARSTAAVSQRLISRANAGRPAQASPKVTRGRIHRGVCSVLRVPVHVLQQVHLRDSLTGRDKCPQVAGILIVVVIFENLMSDRRTLRVRHDGDPLALALKRAQILRDFVRMAAYCTGQWASNKCRPVSTISSRSSTGRPGRFAESAVWRLWRGPAEGETPARTACLRRPSEPGSTAPPRHGHRPYHETQWPGLGSFGFLGLFWRSLG